MKVNCRFLLVDSNGNLIIRSLSYTLCAMLYTHFQKSFPRFLPFYRLLIFTYMLFCLSISMFCMHWFFPVSFICSVSYVASSRIYLLNIDCRLMPCIFRNNVSILLFTITNSNISLTTYLRSMLRWFMSNVKHTNWADFLIIPQHYQNNNNFLMTMREPNSND